MGKIRIKGEWPIWSFFVKFSFHFCKTDQDTIEKAKGDSSIRWNFGNLLNFVNEFLKIIFLQKETCCVICVKFQVILRHRIWLLKLTKIQGYRNTT